MPSARRSARQSPEAEPPDASPDSSNKPEQAPPGLSPRTRTPSKDMTQINTASVFPYLPRYEKLLAHLLLAANQY